jgi:hypothetical protein
MIYKLVFILAPMSKHLAMEGGGIAPKPCSLRHYMKVKVQLQGLAPLPSRKQSQCLGGGGARSRSR